MRFSRSSLALAAIASASCGGHVDASMANNAATDNALSASSAPNHFIMDVYSFQQHAAGKLASATDAILENYASSSGAAGSPSSATSVRSSGKSRGQAAVRSSFARYIQSLALGGGGGAMKEQLDKAFLDPQDEGGHAMLPLTRVTGTTHAHVDHRRAGTGPAVDASDKVAFVMLNSNPDAHFEVDETCIPIVENTLVAFEGGRVSHRTVVESGEVRLLGPFHAETMEPVGGPLPIYHLFDFDLFPEVYLIPYEHGRCRDADSNLYDHIRFEYTEDSVQDFDGSYDWCIYTCMDNIGDSFLHYRGFEGSLPSAEGTAVCTCLFDNGHLPNLPQEEEDGGVARKLRNLSSISVDEYAGTGMVRTINPELDEDDGRDWYCQRLWIDSFYEAVGSGECVDGANESYDASAVDISEDVYNIGLKHASSPFVCAGICMMEPSNTMRGFEVHYTPDEEAPTAECLCLFDNGDVPDYEDIRTSHVGTGPIKTSVQGTAPVWNAAEEVDGTRKLCFKNKMDSNYALVGDGICEDSQHNKYDFLRMPLYDEPKEACASRCLPSTFEFMAPGHGALTENFRGFMVESFADISLSPINIDLGTTKAVNIGAEAVNIGGARRLNGSQDYSKKMQLQGSSKRQQSRRLKGSEDHSKQRHIQGSSKGTRRLNGFEDYSKQRHLQGSSKNQQSKTTSCFCLYDNGTLDNFEFPVLEYETRMLSSKVEDNGFRRLNINKAQEKQRSLEYTYYFDDYVLDQSDVFTGDDDLEFVFNGTGTVTYATSIEVDFSELTEDEEIGEAYEAVVPFSPNHQYTCYRYLDKYEIGIQGVISLSEDICEFDQDEREAFIQATKETLEVKLSTSSLPVDIEIERFCNEGLTGRKLQQTSWQIDFTAAVSSILCGSDGCTSSDDISSVNAMITSISDTLRTYIQGGDFLTQLTQNAALQQALPDGFLECLVAWGTVYATTASQISQTQGNIVTAPATTSEFYPDWTGGTGTCLDDGQEPLYMQKNPSTWLYDSLEGCCERYYGGWNKPLCLGSTGSGMWFVDYEKLKCVTDCEVGAEGSTCGGLVPPHLEEQLYSDPRECCEGHLPWVYSEFCVRDSLGNSCYEGSGKFYRDHENSNVCVRDCEKSSHPQCGGLVDGAWTRLYEDASSCCDKEYAWIDNDLCTARSEISPLDKFWPDQINGKCVKDSDTEATDLSVFIFDTAEECCKEKMNWVALDKCVAEASGLPLTDLGSDEYYVKSGKCVKNCASGNGGDCGGLADNWNHLEDSKSICCSTFLWYIETDECLDA